MAKRNKKINIEAYVVYNPKTRELEGRSRWIDVDDRDKRSDIQLYSTEKKANRAILKFKEYAQGGYYDYLYPIKVNLNIDLDDDVIIEALHPEINLGWTGKGNRNLVDADTFTDKSNGDIISVHVSDDLPDIEYKVSNGSYLDDEAIQDSPYHPDVAANYEPSKESRDKFNDELDKLIRDSVKAEIADTIRSEYSTEPMRINFGGSSGSVPISVSLQASNKRRIPAMYGDKDTIVESTSSWREINKAELELVAKVLGCEPEDIEDEFANVELLNCRTKEEYEREYSEKMPVDFPLGWMTKADWDDFTEGDSTWLDWETCVIEETKQGNNLRLNDKNTYCYVESKLKEEKSDDIYDFISQLYALRKDSIANEGEYGLGNLVFKEFRNLGYLDNLKKLRRIEKSKELSLKELAEAFKTNKKMSRDEFDKFKKAHPDYTFEDKSHGTLIFKDNVQIGTFLKDFEELWLAESYNDYCLRDINYKDDLYEKVGLYLSEKEKGLLWPEFKDKYWLSALEKSDKYAAFNPAKGTYCIYERINNKCLDHIITYIPGYNVMYYKNKDALERLAKAADAYVEEYNKWNDSDGKKKRIADYRRLAKIDNNFVITEDNLDEQAINNTCRINYEYPKEILIKELLN